MLLNILASKFTARTALYMDQFLVNIVIGFSAPITINYFMQHLTPDFIAMVAIIIRISRLMLNICLESKIAIKWVSQNFIKIIIFMDMIFLSTALVGAQHIQYRHIVYNLVGATMLMTIKMVRKDNINSCLTGTDVVTFNASCDSVAMTGALLGSGLISVILQADVNVSVSAAMIAEAIICAIAHMMQAYANYRIKYFSEQEGVVEKRYTVMEMINDITRVFSNKFIIGHRRHKSGTLSKLDK